MAPRGPEDVYLAGRGPEPVSPGPVVADAPPPDEPEPGPPDFRGVWTGAIQCSNGDAWNDVVLQITKQTGARGEGTLRYRGTSRGLSAAHIYPDPKSEAPDAYYLETLRRNTYDYQMQVLRRDHLRGRTEGRVYGGVCEIELWRS